MRDAIRVVIADDHPIVLEGLASLLARRREIVVVGRASGGHEAVSLFERIRPDVTVLDVRMSGVTGLDALARIREIDPAARVLMLAALDTEEDVRRSLQLGARAYILKESSGDEIVSAILRVYEGQRYIPAGISIRLAEHMEHSSLTAREIGVLELAAAGCKNKEIATRLGIAEGTVKGYVNAILLKLAARDRTEAVTIALRRGIIRIDA